MEVNVFLGDAVLPTLFFEEVAEGINLRRCRLLNVEVTVNADMNSATIVHVADVARREPANPGLIGGSTTLTVSPSAFHFTRCSDLVVITEEETKRAAKVPLGLMIAVVGRKLIRIFLMRDGRVMNANVRWFLHILRRIEIFLLRA